MTHVGFIALVGEQGEWRRLGLESHQREDRWYLILFEDRLKYRVMSVLVPLPPIAILCRPSVSVIVESPVMICTPRLQLA